MFVLIRRGITVSGVLIALILFMASGHSLAQTISGPTTGSQHFTDDMIITVPGNASDGTAGIDAGSGDSVTSDSGKIIQIVVEKPNITDHGYYAIEAYEGGSVILGQVDIKSGSTGVLARDGGYVELGDGLSVVADISALYAAVDGEIKVGDGASLVGHVFGNAGATVSANGGIISIGDNVYILNDGAEATYKTDHVAVRARQGGTVTIGDGATLATTGGNASHVVVAGQSTYGETGTVVIGDGFDISTEATRSHGLYSLHTGSTITVGNDGRIYVGGGNFSYAVLASEGGRVEMGQGNAIETDGAGSYALYSYGSTTDSSSITAGANTTVITTGASAFAVVARYGTVELGAGSLVHTTGASGVALYGNRLGGRIKTGDNTNIVTTGASGVGAYAINGGEIVMGDGNGISTSGQSAYGIYSRGVDEETGAQASSVEVGDNLTLTTSGLYGAGVVAFQGAKVQIGQLAKIGTGGDESEAVWATGVDSEITLGDKAFIQTTGDDSAGVLAQNYGKVVIGGGSTIQTFGVDSYGVGAISGGEVELKGDQTISVDLDKGRYALYALGDDGGGAPVYSKISGNGLYKLTGGVFAGEYGDINITMTPGSTFQGFTQVAGPNSSLTMDLRGTRWNITENSELTNLYLDDAIVDFSYSAMETTLKVDKIGKIDEDTIFIMKADVVNERADRVIITDIDNSADHKIFVKNQGGAATTGLEVTTLVETTDLCDDITFQLTSGAPAGRAALSRSGQVVVEVGGFQYVLGKNGTEWQLYSAGAVDPANPGPARVITSTADAAISAHAGAYLLNYAQTQTLLQRLGDLRNSPDQYGAWIRFFGGKFDSNGSDFLHGFDMDYRGLQTGLDYKLNGDFDGDAYVGGYFGYTRGDLDYRYGSGKVDMKTIGLYGTYINPSGFYVDTIVKYGWMDNEFSVLDSQGQRVTGKSYNTGGAGLSLETGKRFHIWKDDPMADPYRGDNFKAFYIEPQAQINYQHQSGGRVKASNDLKVDVKSFNSTTGRVGVNVGYDVKTDKVRGNVYMKASYVHEFDGKMEYKLNGTRLKDSFKGNWVSYGVGGTLQVKDKHNLYLDVERAQGGQFRQPWAVNAGYRISF